MIAAALRLCALASSLCLGGAISDAYLGYTITVPTNWMQVKSKPLQHHFRDSTSQYKSQISIVLHGIDKAAYPTPESWTQAQFIAYKLSVETSVYPFGAVTYFDSSRTTRLSGLWAPEAFSILYPADGTPTYCEFVRYCAMGDFGYEIYAIGDSLDMLNRVDYYADIIATLKLTAPSAGIAIRRAIRDPRAAATGTFLEVFDAAGRRLQGPGAAMIKVRSARQRLFSRHH